MFGSNLKVVSWNIQFGIDVDGAITELREVRPLMDADVVLLQEMDSTGVERLADALDMHRAYASACIHPKSGREFGNAILSATPLHDVRVVDLPHQASIQGTPRLALGARARVGTTDIEVWSVHTEVTTMRWWKRAEQFDAVAAAVGASDADRLLVGGDFNTATDRSITGLTERMATIGANRITTQAGHSLRRVRRRFTLDHIFTRGITTIDVGACADTLASDHAPIWADLRLTTE
jgi:endonuclease/exonuclease/phosphatase family metal-dependent hydrolase